MYAEVIPALPVEQTFYYYVEQDLPLYSYVVIPFGTRKIMGLIVALHDTCNVKDVKTIEKAFNVTVSAGFISFIKWASHYNLIPIGLLIKAGLSGINTNEEYYSLSVIPPKVAKPAYKKVIALLSEHITLSECEICDKASILKRTLVNMHTEGIIESVNRCNNILKKVESNICLTAEQKQACASIKNNLPNKTILLDGVTGSGKTEVYLQIIADILSKDLEAQALILLPEIVLADQAEQRFSKYFKDTDVFIWHSSISQKMRRKYWWLIVNGEARLIIGARSALFLPYKKLKIIVVDEEHDSSFKQTGGTMNYNARDMAIALAHKQKIGVILSSATPSVETMYNALSGKFHHVLLQARYSQIALPEIKIVDMRKDKNKNFISCELYDAIRSTIKDKKQVLLFLNRRGYSPFIICNSCGYKPMCINCSSYLVHHRIKNYLLCHHCNFKITVPRTCNHCKEDNKLISYGVGIERLVEEVKNYIPGAKLVTISSDSAADFHLSKKLILSGEIDIIIGTNMVTKGHHFPQLALVGVIDADAVLYGGDLRAAERTYQVLQQVSGRAGRENDRGLVLLQTYQPQEITNKYLCGRQDFYNSELQSRKENSLPPFSRIATITVKHSKLSFVELISHNISQSLLHPKLKVLGPMPATIHLIKKRYIYKILIIYPKQFDVQSSLKNCAAIKKYQRFAIVDIDSIDLL